MDDEKKQSNAGRPRALNDTDKKKILRLATFGFTDNQIAEVFGITTRTLNNYKKDDPEFFQSLKAHKELADAEVIESIFNRAKGMSITEQKAITVSDGKDLGAHVEIVEIERELPPDVNAGMFWLKNRQPDKFRDKVDIEQSGEINVKIPNAKLLNV
jgi:hypothetical protein